MARIYKRPRSPYWWIEYRDPNHIQTDAHGRIKPRRESTYLRIGNGPDFRRAKDLEAEKTLLERRFSSTKHDEYWDVWVVPYIQSATRGFTQVRYLSAWRSLRKFLEEKNVPVPRLLTYDHLAHPQSGYLAWRLKPDKAAGKYKAGKNTAILEIKVLRWLLREAVRRGFAPANVARELVLKRDQRKVFPEFTREQMDDFETALQKEPEPWRTAMLLAFRIARYHGVRLNETNVNPCQDVHLWPSTRDSAVNGLEGSIRFHQKGSKIKEKPLHPRLIPLFEELIKAKAHHTYPPGVWNGNRWHRFFRPFRALVPNATFHSLRVTVKNQLDAAGIPTEIVREYLSHTPQDVHSSYGRFDKLDKLRVCHAALG